MTTETTAPESADGVKPKAPRFRSIAYPSYTLEASLKFVTQIHDEFTSLTFTPPEDISKMLQLSGGAFLQKLSTSVQYGLLQLKKGDGYKPTDDFNKIIKPIPGEDVNDFLLECLLRPELYKKLFEAFKDKQLPSEAGLVNILDRLYGVKGAGAASAAKIFFANIKAANLIDGNNVLKVSTYIPFVEVSNSKPPADDDNVDENESFILSHLPPATPVVQEPKKVEEVYNPNNGIIPQKKVNNNKEISILLNGDDREAIVSLPKDFSEEDLKRVIKVLTAYV